MRKGKENLVYAPLAAVLGYAVWCYGIQPRLGSRSLAEALASIKDLGDTYVLLPIAGGTRLGQRAEHDFKNAKEAKIRHLTVNPTPCFFLPEPTTRKSLAELIVTYKAAQTLNAELGNLLYGDARKDTYAKLTLENLSVADALGILNPNGPCATSGRHYVVTTEVVAQHVSLELGEKVLTTLAAEQVLPDKASAAAVTGWAENATGLIRGESIVIGGQLREVTVETLNQRGDEDLSVGIPLGVNPSRGRRELLPDGLSGHLSVGGYSFTDEWLEVTINGPLGAEAKSADGFATCPVGRAVRVPLDRGCNYLLGTGNVLLQVSWSRDEDGVARLHMNGFRTAFAPQ